MKKEQVRFGVFLMLSITWLAGAAVGQRRSSGGGEYPAAGWQAPNYEREAGGNRRDGGWRDGDRYRDHRDDYSPGRDGFDPGQVWRVREDDWEGTWIRRGRSMIFDARWYHRRHHREVRDVLVLEEVRGREVILYRQGTRGRYFGYLSRDGRTVEHGRLEWSPGGSWRATIEYGRSGRDDGRRDFRDDDYGDYRDDRSVQFDAGRRWKIREGEWEGVWTRRGRSDLFDARWRHLRTGREVRDVIHMESCDGRQVVLYREGTRGRYCGIISRDRRQIVDGTMDWDRSGGRWEAWIE